MVCATSSCTAKTSSILRSYCLAQRSAPVAASINCAVIRTRVPARRTLPSLRSRGRAARRAARDRQTHDRPNGEFGTREYVGTAFVTFTRPLREEFNALIEANTESRPKLPPNRERKSKDPVQFAPRHHGPSSPFAWGENATRHAGQHRLALILL